MSSCRIRIRQVRIRLSLTDKCVICRFDAKYIHGRSLVLVDDATGDPMVDLTRLGRMIRGGGEVIERDLNSAAFGQNKFFTLSTPGVMQLDTLQWMRKNRSHDSYSLANLAKVYLKDEKIDLPAHQIFEKYLGTRDDRAVIAEYAIRDTELPLQLMDKLAMLPDLFEMANAVKIPVDFINNRGQQVGRCGRCGGHVVYKAGNNHRKCPFPICRSEYSARSSARPAPWGMRSPTTSPSRSTASTREPRSWSPRRERTSNPSRRSISLHVSFGIWFSLGGNRLSDT